MVSRLGEPDGTPPLRLPEIAPLPPIRKWNVFYKLGSPQAAQLISSMSKRSTITKTAFKNAIYPP